MVPWNILKYSLPIVGRTYQNMARYEESKRWLNDFVKNTGRLPRYPWKSGTHPSIYGTTLNRGVLSTVSDVMRL